MKWAFVSFAEEDGQVVKFISALFQQNEAFTVTVTHRDAEGSTESSSELLNSLDAVEVYLRAQTPFILSDFRR